ncbi:MAG: ASKHA domain-containing protein [Propionibacteriaceae bacterium]|jgi:uncharacterized 2Fe-2S/4Fe-4S cluster protein (DUF4445 family)|nr:ASKHA domain-containing protein [Propionibacteriaceae bacterium]
MDSLTPTPSGLLADALEAAGHHLPMPCRGRHTCGKCQLYVSGAVLPPSEQEALLLARSPRPALPGYETRLACLARISGPVSILASSVSQVAVAPCEMGLASYDGTNPDALGVAIDIGTTTVTVLVFRLGDGERLADASALNHQVRHGSDVLSRIDAAASVGVDTLRELIVEQLGELLAEALSRADATADQVERAAITGNTTMLHLLVGLPVHTLGVAPFTPASTFGESVSASSVLPELVNAELYLPPAISAYVGPDIVCGILATGLDNAILVDVGTNGEMALANGGRLWCCSTAAGPAFEGAEISSGMPALPGAIDSVSYSGGKLSYTTIGAKKARGLCGTGLIGAVNALLDAGIIDETGAMEEDAAAIGTSSITLAASDVRKLQLAKAAIAAGIETLLSESGCDVCALHLAGGFGSYLDPVPAAGIGLIPESLAECAEPAGNTALTGAVMLALTHRAREEAAKIAANAVEVQLSTNPVFMESYIDCMAFPEREL